MDRHHGGGGDSSQEGAAVDKAALSQLFMTVCNLAAGVASLVQQMSGLAQRLDNQVSSNVTQDLIRKEIIEPNERYKHKHSIILKGLMKSLQRKPSLRLRESQLGLNLNYHLWIQNVLTGRNKFPGPKWKMTTVRGTS